MSSTGNRDMSWADLDGRIMPLDRARVPVTDRSFLFGDAVIETLRVAAGVPWRLAGHLVRLRAGAAALGLAVPGEDAALTGRVRRLLLRAGAADGVLRIRLSRGDAGAALAPDPRVPPRLLLTYRPGHPYPPATWRRGLRLALVSWRRPPANVLPPLAKTANYLPFILARREALAAGADDALLLTVDGLVAEASASNLFWVRGRTLYTPALSLGILPGVTRLEVMELARRQGLAVREAALKPNALRRVDELFVTNSLIELAPVTTLDLGHPPAVTLPAGPVRRGLHQAWRRELRRGVRAERSFWSA